MDSTWQWICSECIPAIESKLIDCSVQIYWTSYSKYFRGSIDALDLVSHEHRVLYEDGEWEYVQLAKEDFFIQIPSNILEKLTKKDANKSTNSTRSDLSLIVPNSSLGVEQESDLEDKPANLKSNRRSTPRRAK